MLIMNTDNSSSIDKIIIKLVKKKKKKGSPQKLGVRETKKFLRGKSLELEKKM